MVWSAINTAGDFFEPFAWKKDAAAHGHSAQEEWTRQLARTDIASVLLWKKLGLWTKEEIEISRKSGIPILLFRKKDGSEALRTSKEVHQGLDNVRPVLRLSTSRRLRDSNSTSTEPP